ncbi:MAG: hypothetical protein ACXACY_14035 [Candidatus Hodarchaeales archaeon]|jgi:hypothetical protein
MGAGTVAERQHHRLHGSIPIPDSPNLEALAMSFPVSPIETSDLRIDQHGRESTIWLLFDSEKREIIFRAHRVIEKALQEETRKITYEKDLSNPEIMDIILKRIKNIIDSPDLTTVIMESVEPVNIVERGGLEFFSVDTEGKMNEIDPRVELSSCSVLILVNTILKRIFLIRLKETIPHRLIFLASTAMSNINTNRFKNEFSVRDVQDPMEREMILEKIGIILKIDA